MPKLTIHFTPGASAADIQLGEELAAELELQLKQATKSLHQRLQTLLDNDRRNVLSNYANRLGEYEPAREMLLAALLEEVDQTGPAGGRTAIYLPRESGSKERRIKARIGQYRDRLTPA